MTEDELPPQPGGELALKTVALPRDTNAHGDISAGWLVSQMDLAAEITAANLAKGRVVTVAIEELAFMRPIAIGASVNCHTEILEIGRSSMRILVEVWTCLPADPEPYKITEGEFVLVALDDEGRARRVVV
ncbi:MAG TPA: acyl-CoA thioesterase [Pseudomonadales bacterium]|jgi:acyl-CoA thioesterase YciA|nr:acyl-CoA thioesterase [Pseudomonadales bacterium]HMU91193.1 acyl-CoA thioesterase [Pseudomonadales bacterium]HMW14491.1 acyl-CoA thioesterase [Pseudomonadales bacterium]HMW82282.1 acyl-CoA thioesterase [Pseudomonadales bacterium]HMY97742.1 acyl-CoA thioesterase [Pseudomonadales bacterium]